MGCELVTSSESSEGGDGTDIRRPSLFRYTEIFERYCAYYMALGMSYDEYWNGDNELPMYYREKYKYDTERRNQEMWLQGAYVYDAMCRAAPLYDVMSKKREPIKYLEHPYPLTKEAQEKHKKDEARKQMLATRDYFVAFSKQFNERFKGQDADGKEV